MFGGLCGFNTTKQRLTVVFDKGMNSEDNVAFIDDHTRIHFVTTYSTYFAEDLAATELKHFSPLAVRHNESLIESDNTADCILGYRTTRELWGKEAECRGNRQPADPAQETVSVGRKAGDHLPGFARVPKKLS